MMGKSHAAGEGFTEAESEGWRFEGASGPALGPPRSPPPTSTAHSSSASAPASPERRRRKGDALGSPIIVGRVAGERAPAGRRQGRGHVPAVQRPLVRQPRALWSEKHRGVNSEEGAGGREGRGTGASAVSVDAAEEAVDAEGGDEDDGEEDAEGRDQFPVVLATALQPDLCRRPLPTSHLLLHREKGWRNGRGWRCRSRGRGR